MKINANSIRVGNVIEWKDKLWSVLKISHTQPGKGGAFVQVEMKDLRGGTKLNERFRSNEYITKAHLDSIEYQYLYSEANDMVLMNLETYEQIHVSKEFLGKEIGFLTESTILTVNICENDVISVELPEKLVLEVLEVESVVKSQTAASSYKPVVVINNIRIMAPPFIEIGDKILVKTFDQSYVERVK